MSSLENRMIKWIKIVGVLIISVAVIAAIKILLGLNAKARIGVGYKVKVTCSEVFVAGRNLDDVLASDFFGIDPILLKAKVKVNRESGVVTGSLFGLGSSEARYRPEAGCSVAAEKGVDPVSIPPANLASHSYTVAIDPDIQAPLLALFDDDNTQRPIVTRGAVVIQDGKIVAEHYAPSFTKDTRQQSWSMAKSVTSALVGVLADEGRISIDETHLIKDWQGDDPRADITLSSLLHMSSGLDTHEVYSDINSDVVQMLFNSRDTGKFAAAQAYESPRETVFEYSSATTNLISRIIRERINDDDAYHAFPRKALFDPLGMRSAIFEVDPAGNFIGSSYIYATPRDFARMGQLFLQSGKWDDQQLLSEDWVKYSLTAGPATNGAYGAQWWLNGDGVRLPDFPRDVFFMGGNDDQLVIAIPSKNAIIVRMGITRLPATFETDVYPRLRAIYDAL